MRIRQNARRLPPAALGPRPKGNAGRQAQGRARSEDTDKCGGRKSYLEGNPEMVALATKLARYTINGRKRSLRDIAAEFETHGHVAPGGKELGLLAGEG
jgi:hypothetical protein